MKAILPAKWKRSICLLDLNKIQRRCASCVTVICPNKDMQLKRLEEVESGQHYFHELASSMRHASKLSNGETKLV